MTTNNHDFPLNSNEYAAFDAISLRNLIIERLNKEGLITDQNFIGSNISSIIDIISYSFNTLIYYLNKTSTESLFSEAQLYENINRIVKLLDYKPVGFQTSLLPYTGYTPFLTKGLYTIPRYSYIILQSVIYSFNEDITFLVEEDFPQNTIEGLTNKKLLHQGIYRQSPAYTAAGDSNETVTIFPFAGTIDHFNIDVYVLEKNATDWIKYTEVGNFYGQRPFDRVFEKRLNSDLSYEIKFGDDLRGRQLNSGDKVVVFYLESNGTDGVIDTDVVTDLVGVMSYQNSDYEEIVLNNSNSSVVYLGSQALSQIYINKTFGSTLPKPGETADEIRKNAPKAFKTQYRLVNKSDFDSYIRLNFSSIIKDVKIFSNWEYMSKYLKYFYEINVSPVGFNQILFNQVSYADSCNFNNIYICGLPRSSANSALKYLLPTQKEIILSSVNEIKILTTEVSFLDPIYKAITFGFAENSSIGIENRSNYVMEIVRNRGVSRSDESIQREVAEKITQTFSSDIKLGHTFDYKKLVSDILMIEGVSKIRTRNVITQEFVEGISLFVWNPTYPDLDKSVAFNNIILEDFMYGYFEDLINISTKILIS